MPDSPATRAFCRMLADSHARLVGRPLVPGQSTMDDAALAGALFALDRPLVAHGTEADPIFCYANAAALALWGMGWSDFTRLPSRRSAEADAATQQDRDRLLAEARENGWIAGYAGIRRAANGQRFRIADTVLWTVQDAAGQARGQAALIGWVEPLASPLVASRTAGR